MTDTIRVLYVDDEPDLLELGKLFLENIGDFSVDTIDSATSALDLIEKEPVDAIVSDYQMPGMDGIQFLIEVRKRYGSVPFILFTGRGREEVVIKALNGGANFYLQKGGEPKAQFAELAHKIRSAVEHHRDELKISTLNRLYGVLSATNNAIVRIHSKKELMEEICRIAVDNGGFVMAWAGLADEEKKTIRPTCAHGHIDSYLETIDISTKNIPRGLGPTGTAYREKIISYCNDIVTDPRMEPWREKALERGYRSNAAFPFALGTRNAGVMTLYAAEPGFFNDQTLKLLDELSENISYALAALDYEDEKKESEEALRQSEEKYRRIVDTAHEGIWAMDNQFVTTYVNERLAEMLGYTVDEILGKTIQSFMYEEELADQQLKIEERKACQTGSYERRFKAKDGTSRVIHVSASPLMEDDGSFMGSFAMLTDITAKKRAEREVQRKNEELEASYEELAATNEEIVASQQELRNYAYELARQEKALRQSEARLREILDATLFPVALVDLQDNNIEFWSRSALTMFGHTAPTMAEWYQLAYPDPGYRQEVIGRWKPFLEQARLSGQPVNTGEYRVTCRDGTVRTCELYATFLADKLVVTFNDITGRKQAVAALTENEERLRTTLNILPVGVFIFSKNGQILTANVMVNRIWGVTEGVVPLSSGMEDFVEYKGWWPDTGVALRPEDWAASRVLMQGEAAPVDIVNIQRFDGSFGTIIVSAVPIHDGGGNINGAVAVIQDITERKQAEDELLRKNVELEASYEGLAASEEELRHNIEELTLADIEIRKSKRELTDIIEFLPDATFVIDQDGIVIAWNRAIEEMTGICKDHMIGKGDHEYSIPFYGERRKQLLDLLDLEDEELESKYQYVTRKGTTLYAEVFTPELYGGKGAYVWATVSPLFDDNGDRIGAIESIRDITGWKQAEKAFHTAEKDYHYLLEHLDDVYYRSDSEGRLILASSSWAKKLGYNDISECLGKNIAEAFYADSDERKRFLDEVNRNGYVSDYEVTLKKKDGTSLPVATSSYLCYDESGKVLGVEGTWRDISRRKQTDAALRESEDRFRGIFDTSTSGVAIYEVMNNGVSGKDYIIKDFNKTALEIEGKKKDEVIGKSLFDLRPAIDEYGLIPVFQQVWKTGVPAYFPQKVYIDEKYSNWYENRVFRLQSGEIVAVYDDVTERKRAELELVSAQEQVKKAHHLAHIGTWDWIMETDTVTWSEELFNIAGRDPSQPAPTYAEHPGVYTPSSWQILSDAAGKALTTGEPYNLELELIRPDGSIRWTNAFGGIKRDRDGTVIGLHGTLQDITERKTAEDAHRKSEEKFRLLIDQTDEGVWIIDQDYRTTFVNNRLASMFGYSTQEMLGKPMRDFMPVEDMPFHNQRMKERLEGKRDRFEQRFIRKDGSVFWVIASVTPFVSENGVSGEFAMLTDITDRKRAEEELRHLTEFQDSVITNARVWLSVLDSGGRVLLWNTGAEEISGYSSEEVVREKEIWKKIYPDSKYRKKVTETISRVIHEKNYLENFETTILTKAGEEKVISWNTKGMPETTGNVSEYIAIGVDVTDRAQAKEAMRESEEKYRTLVEKANEAIIIAQDGVFAFANRSMSELLGVPVTDLEGRAFIDYIWPEDREWVVQNYKKRISGEIVPDAYDFRIIGAGGRLRWASLSAAVIQWKGRPATINLITDITERKQAEDDLRKSEEWHRTILETTMDGFWMIDIPSGRFNDANETYCRMTGYTRDELLELDIPSIDAMLTPSEQAARIRDIITNGSGIFETRHRRKDGSIFDVEISVTYQNSEGGQFICFCRDITERKKSRRSVKRG
jgi:PAS domain S-box-containing protein